MILFPKGTPEETGISSKSILRFINQLKKNQIPMHSLLLVSKGKLITEAYYDPIKEDSLQRMFSISKSFTSIAIGLLADEGKLSLDDKIISYFPDKLPKNPHPFLKEMTIRDMLMMRTCHASTTYKVNEKSDWVESFFTVEPTHPSGRIFHYDTSSAHTLCALVERITGQKILNFLKEKLSPLPFSKESYFLTDPFGVSLGGSGLVATSRDLLSFTYLLANKGFVFGKQLLSKEYIETATSLLTSTSMPAGFPDTTCGYGYQFWRHSKNSFFAYGMGGQLIAFYPDKELILITTADTQFLTAGIQLILDSFYQEIYDQVAPTSLSPLSREENLQYEAVLQNLSIAPLAGNLNSTLSDSFYGKTFFCAPNKNGFLSFSLTREKLSFSILQDGCEKNYELVFGFGANKMGSFPIYDMRYAASAIWQDDHTLMIYAHILDAYMGCVKFQLSFTNHDLTVFMLKKEESLFQEFQGHLYCTLES